MTLEKRLTCNGCGYTVNLYDVKKAKTVKNWLVVRELDVLAGPQDIPPSDDADFYGDFCSTSCLKVWVGTLENRGRQDVPQDNEDGKPAAIAPGQYI